MDHIMLFKPRGLKAMMPKKIKLKKRPFGTGKYPITKLAAGESVTIPIESSAHEGLIRKSAENWNARNKGFISARKKGSEITFTRIR
jgi:hypothetical protein